ncbi:carbamoyl-phosphate synthase (glutamine-hydrolyzing) large subunit [Patescibacteria group bacterium]|nr:carbamoyl-phosphate synthase (glutamine-hydrolyzing) large subunit [Patescibacteria group bacterium]MCL5010308.1 carbamoyl-phosphate synthase (glutamine-hydrolyzing) large subunit [Patescibacteria group bacterium]
MSKIKKVLILGSGALKIGEAGEFDYSGSQAIKALKEEKIKTILVNPNIATVQTSKNLADEVYFLPVNDYFVEKIIEKEKPDSILLSFGGQTALNCGIALNKRSILKKHNVKILGTPIKAIILTEDRKKFADHLRKLKIPTPESRSAKNINEALKIARQIGFPVMVRSGYALGGQGSGVASNIDELKEIAARAFAFAPQILVEQYLHHFKEIEYEIVRDRYDNCIAVCNMENMDPLGIHTGESIVVAPSQTLNNFEYHGLRSIAVKIVRSLGIIGECNVQFALNPNPRKNLLDYYVIEVNARLSRSSALASKATGYPLAWVAAKLAIGKGLTEIKNKVTLKTSACFEPSLDYIVVKIPRWDIEKFRGADERIGSSMKSVGEVMGIGRKFEEAYQKAIRMLDLDFEGATSDTLLDNGKTITELLKTPTPKRMFAVAAAMKSNITASEIYRLTGIDPWFLYRIKNIADAEKNIPPKLSKITKQNLLELKKLGFSDKRIGTLVNSTGLSVRKLRKKYNIIPYVMNIDTMAGEFPAKTNYLYLTYNANHNDITPLGNKGVMVLGSGPYRIGSSVEFDWTSVNTAINLKKYNKESIIINCNPETVSTDYDVSKRLYFEELTFERLADIYDFENPFGVIVSVGGQTPNNRAKALKAYGAEILGTDPKNIDRAEERSKFSKLLDNLNINQPAWNKFTNIKSALSFCERTGYPVLLRPSYVLSGTLMRICHNRNELTHFLQDKTKFSKDYPITVSKFIEEAKELEFDAVSQNGKIITGAICEHIENAGVHSGDASIVFPSQKTSRRIQKIIEETGEKLAGALAITGPFNIQFLVKENTIQVIEINLRSSRTFPFISKITGVNFSELATDAFFNQAKEQLIHTKTGFAAVKIAQFSFARLTGADPIVHVEMSSTGEVACFGKDTKEAFLKGEIAVGGKIPQKGIFVSLGGERNKILFLPSVKKLAALGIPIFATKNTSIFLDKNGIRAKHLYKIHEKKSPNILEFFQKAKIDLAINITDEKFKKDIDDDFAIRRSATDHNIPLFTKMEKAGIFADAVTDKALDNLEIKSWSEYIK